MFYLNHLSDLGDLKTIDDMMTFLILTMSSIQSEKSMECVKKKKKKWRSNTNRIMKNGSSFKSAS